MSDGAGKGPRVRPLDGSSIHRSIAGGLSARAAGGKGFGMIGHTGSHGRSMVARVRSAATGCIDTFSRVTNGWGQAPWCLPAWSTDTAPRLSVGSGYGRLTCTNSGAVPPYLPARAYFDYPADPIARYPGKVVMRLRRQGASTLGSAPSDGGYGIPLQWFISPSTNASDAHAVEGYFEYTYSDIQGPYIELLWIDHRSGSGGTWENDYSLATVDVTFANLFEWWNMVVLIDDYGTYSRLWRDGEDEFVRVAPTQPEDVFGTGCPQGGGESWQIWEAYSVPLDSPNPTMLRFDVREYGTHGSPELYVDVDDLGFTGSLCPCG